MGASFSTDIVIGVRVADVLQVKTLTKTETKYDPDTGKPYEKKTDEWVATLFGQERPGLEANPEEWEHSPYVKRPSVLPEGFKTFDTGNDSSPDFPARFAASPYQGWDYTRHVVGVQLNGKPGFSGPSPPSIESLTWDELVLAFARVGKMFADLLGYHGPVKLFVVSRVSY